jgi:signal-transduction protein with cAMP-binding, CBS, and nucleotidyltransferase domain
MITDRDITMRGVADARNVTQMTVREAMSAEVLFCFEDDPIEQAAALMSQSHVQRLAVLDRETQHLIGVISVSDLSGGRSERRPYEVTFYKKFSDHYGHPHHSELMRIVVAHSVHRDERGAMIEELELTSEREARIRRRAHELCEHAGAPTGRDLQFWEQATGEIDNEDRSRA